MSFATNTAPPTNVMGNVIGNVMPFQSVTPLSAAEIENLLVKLARGHLSTMQEEYAALKKMLCC